MVAAVGDVPLLDALEIVECHGEFGGAGSM
jgi:hypothetical protein